VTRPGLPPWQCVPGKPRERWFAPPAEDYLLDQDIDDEPPRVWVDHADVDDWEAFVRWSPLPMFQNPGVTDAGRWGHSKNPERRNDE
jgi:hypothetical protein